MTPLQTNTSCSNVPSFTAWDRLWLHYNPTHPVAMSRPSRRGTDCDSTTNQHILKQCPILQGVGQTVTPLQTNTSWSNVPSFKVWDRQWHQLWLHHSSNSMAAEENGRRWLTSSCRWYHWCSIKMTTKHQSTSNQVLPMVPLLKNCKLLERAKLYSTGSKLLC